MTIVLAGHYDEFRYWCRENGVSIRDREVVYASTAHHIRGIHNAKIITVGTFWERKDAGLLWEEALFAQLP